MIDRFILEFLQNYPTYEAWGNFVASEIMRRVIEVDGRTEDSLLKVPLQLRIKKESSVRAKIARYELLSPKDEITDLVGIRFIVLLKSELNLFEAAIEQGKDWTFKKVKDFGAQAVNNPEIFDYQSIHYVVSAAKDIEIKGLKVINGTSCEVQIRTLLQHAYAELTHDNIYKPVQIVPHIAKRYVARSMALMETTDDLFNHTLDALRTANEPRNKIFKTLYNKFIEERGWFAVSKTDERTNLEIIETYIDQIVLDTFDRDIQTFSQENDWLQDFVLEYAKERFLFTQPVIILLFWLIADEKEYVLKERWTLMSLKEDLRLVFNQMGVAFGDQL